VSGGGDRVAVPAPRVSIIVPAHNCPELTEACLLSVARTTRLPYEVLLVDDASDESAAAVFRRLSVGPVRLLRNETRRSFSANNNLAAREARGEFLCLLNNDTVVAPGWLEAMVAVIEREPDIGVLGNKHLFPDRPGLHHAGMAFDERGFPIHLHPHTDPEAPAVNYQRDVPCVTFACVVIPAAVYLKLGGLDETYRNGFEDCDFCLRARGSGYRVTYTPASVIGHYGQKSPNRTRFDDENWRLFQKRHPDRERGSLERITREDLAYNALVRGRPRRTPAAPEGLHFAVDFAAGNAFTWATVSLIEALRATDPGVAVSVAWSARVSPSIPAAQRRDLRRLMRKQPCGTWHVKWSHYWPAHLKQDLWGEVNAELFCTNYRCGPGRQGPDAWLRNVQVNGYRKLPVSGFNLEALRDIGVPERDCAVVPLGYSPEIDRLYPQPPQRLERSEKHLLLVTNSHDLYRYGTDVALRAVGSAFGPGDPVVLHIKDYGAASGSHQLRAWIAAQPRFPRIVWHTDFLPKEDLIRLYAGMDALLAPYRGEGFSMKVLDAMALGLPVFMPAFGGPTEFAVPGTFLDIPWRRTPVGPCLDRDQFYLGDDAWWCEPDAQSLAGQLHSWAADGEAARRAGEAAARHVRGRYTWANAARQLLDSLRGWRSRQLVSLSARRQPDERPLSVVIPTKDRNDTLVKTLDAYARQSLPARDYDLIIVNDHGPRDPLEAAVRPFRERLPLQLLDNAGPGGPAAARNAGIDRARGGIVLITGDDIVPDPEFLRAHVEAHRRFPTLETGMIGLNKWHPDLPLTTFMHHITGEGGQQFNYAGLEDGGPAGFDRFYTSNCSLKRAFLLEEPSLFSTAFSLAAYEDVELAYRLHLRGLRLRYLAGAIGYHDHAMTPASFLQRQVRTGRMLALLSAQRPAYVPDEHRAFLAAMDFALRQFREGRCPPLTARQPLSERLLPIYEWLLALEEANARPDPEAWTLLRQDAVAWAPFLREGANRVWEAANVLALRQGMAEEWAQNEQDRDFLAAWLEGITASRLLGDNDLFWRMPHTRGQGAAGALFPTSTLVYYASRFLRSTPGVKEAVVRLENSKAGRRARDLALRMLKRG
jgi:GT2 family glycosyltransferase